ncbi:MAG: glycosyltransferase family 4 protein [Solirubrobacteraceae bacterium]
MPIALLTNYLVGYRMPLYERLAARHGVEVLCYGGGDRYAPPWITDSLDAQLRAAPFPARRLDGGARAAFQLTRGYDAVIAPYAGGAILPAAYAGVRAHRRAFVLWASVWAQPRSAANTLALPVTRHIYRHADAVVAYGEHARRFVAGIRGRDGDVFVAPQSVEPELFAASLSAAQIEAFRTRHQLGTGPLVLYAGRLVREKGAEVLLDAWTAAKPAATLVLIGGGPLAALFAGAPSTRLLGPLPRAELPAAYAAAQFAVLPSIPTPRFLEPWGLVCNEAMHQARPMIATTAVGAVAGGLVRHRQTGLVVAPGDPAALAQAIGLLLGDEALRNRLGERARETVGAYTYDAMVQAFDRALAVALGRPPTARAPTGRPPTEPHRTRTPAAGP